MILTAVLAATLGSSLAGAQPGPTAPITIDARAAVAPPETGWLRMGSPAADRSPAGHVLSVNSRYLALDGRPWLPVMGEFHFSRYPDRFWEEELLKLKAGGLQIVSTYVFWIHHEEVEGRFDWSGQRDLRRFVQLCARSGLCVWLRIGPWAHGEARNGGFPDWLLAQGPTRVNDPAYLARVRDFFGEIGRQVQGLLWKDGGPIVGVQIENEYTNRGSSGGAGHLETLKRLAIEAGLDVPFYTATGWDHAVVPPREFLPVFGGYPDEAWSGRRTEMPPDTQGVYQFAPTGGNAGILQGAAAASPELPLGRCPRLTAELGAGMEDTYHRRVAIAAPDIPPIAITALGSGANLLGYYMIHGGANPDGQRSTLQESQATGYPNDVPVKSYDFQAPLGEFGQVRESFRRLKVIHQFLADFGAELAPMVRVLPQGPALAMDDTTTLRVAARAQGDRAFVFFNNYLRHYPLPARHGVQVALQLPSGTVVLPEAPVDIPAQTAFFWPVNLDLDGALLSYATAQPFARLADGDATDYFFVAAGGVPAEFVFAAPTVAELQATSGTAVRRGDRIVVAGMAPSPAVAVAIRPRVGRPVRIVLLSDAQAADAWKVSVGGRERMLLTSADVFCDGDTLHLRSRDVDDLRFSVAPDAGQPLAGSAPLRRIEGEGMFATYRATVAAQGLRAELVRERDAAAAPPVKLGPAAAWRGGGVAQAPDEAAFAAAGVWRLQVPPGVPAGLSDAYLVVRYVGDVARLDAGPRLVDDNFYNGAPWEIGLKRFDPGALAEGLRLEILPLRRDAPIYLPAGARPDFAYQSQIAAIASVELVPEYEVTVRFGAGREP